MSLSQFLPLTTFPNVNTFRLGGVGLPGKWTLLSAPKKFGWQIQQGYGLSGAFVFPKGDELVVPKFKGEFWNSNDYLLFQAVQKSLLIKGVVALGAISSALGIYHPELARLGVTSVVVGTIGPLIQGKGGLWSIEIEFLQYRPPLPAPPKPKQVIPTNTAPLPTAQNNRQREIQQQENTKKDLLKQLNGGG